MPREPDRSAPRRVVWPLLFLALCLFGWAAVLTFDLGDWPSPHQYPHNQPVHNACGRLGASAAYGVGYTLGAGVYPLLLFATLSGLTWLVRGSVGSAIERGVGLLLVVTCTSVSVHLIAGGVDSALPLENGGILGFALGELLRGNVSSVGTFIVVAASLFVGLVFATEGWVLSLPSLARSAGEASSRALSGVAAHALQKTSAFTAPIPRPAAATAGVSQDESAALLQLRKEAERETPGRSRREESAPSTAEGAPVDSTEAEVQPGSSDLPPGELASEETSPPAGAGEGQYAARLAKARSAARLAAGPIVRFSQPIKASRTEAYPRQIENWRLPDLSLLSDPEYSYTAQQESMVREQARVLEQTLEEFRVEARVVEIDTGPVITMFELKLGAGIKVSQIASLSNDIARALKAHAIRVVAPISGKNTVGIEVPNLSKEMVRLKELMTLAGKRASEMGLPLFLGKDAGGAALVADLTKMPHLLIAGTTGSGKSVCLNAVILSILMTQRPDHVKMILVDPKMVEMSQFKDVPHLMCPIVTDMLRAEKILEWAVTKMEERYELLAEARVKNVNGYNALGDEELLRRFDPQSEEEAAQIPRRLPYIVIVIDELADLMMTSAKEVEHHLSRLAQKSRAVGIHIMVATQRPEAKVVTGLIKSNLPSRICFRVASRMDSRIVLDQNGGEVLMGQGDMLFLPPGSHKLIRAQGTFLDDSEVQAVLQDLSGRARPEFHPELERMRNASGDEGAMLRDPLFDAAVRIILESKRGSVSLLQRRLTIGYSRASRLIDQMAEAGIVGVYKGSQAREVLMTLPEWEAMRRQVEAELEEGYAADSDEDADGEEVYTTVSERATRDGR